MRGKWASGIQPRNFFFVIPERLAISERPGGFAPNHRRVRRQEEIIWLKNEGFARVVSLLPSPHNLAAYEEERLPYAHFPLPASGDVREVLASLFGELEGWLAAGEKVLLHQEELGERVMGVAAAYLCWSGQASDPVQAINWVERVVGRRMGMHGRAIVAELDHLPRRDGASLEADQGRRGSTGNERPGD